MWLTTGERQFRPSPGNLRLLAYGFLLELIVFVGWRSSRPASADLLGYAIVDAGWKADLLRAAATFTLVLFATELSLKVSNLSLNATLRQSVSARWLALHVAAVMSSVTLPFLLNKCGPDVAPLFVTSFRVVLLASAALTAALSLLRFDAALVILGHFRWQAWACAGLTSALINPVTKLLWSVNSKLSGATFWLVRALLRPLMAGILERPDQRIIGTDQFSVKIAPGCSGLEGMVLLLVLSALYLWLSREDHRFPQSLLLLPFALATSFVLNSFRIAGLVLVGNAGAVDFAVNAFHSQAGWLAFNAVTLSLWFVIRRIDWFAISDIRSVDTAGFSAATYENPAAPYLVPLLLVLGSTLLLPVIANQAEWIRSLQIVVGAIALWNYREKYSVLQLTIRWETSIWVGVGVALLWSILDRLQHPGNLPSLPPWEGFTPMYRDFLILFQTAGAAVTMPMVQELAFRGFLLRRLQSANFESIPYTALGLKAILVSSLLFGALCGQNWLAGCVAGVAYAMLIRRTGRLGSAVLAHAIANAVLSITALVSQRWSFCC